MKILSKFEKRIKICLIAEFGSRSDWTVVGPAVGVGGARDPVDVVGHLRVHPVQARL